MTELKNKRYSEDFVCAITWCFQPTSSLFAHYFRLNRVELVDTILKHQTWREDIKVGDTMDVEVHNEFRDASIWLRGTVIEEEENLLSFEFPLSTTDTDCSHDRYSPKIAQLGTKTDADYEWRQKAIWDSPHWTEVDTYYNREWYETTIIDKTFHELKGSGRTIQLVKVAFRVYREDRRSYSVDQHGKYDGFAAQYDQWMPLFGPRIQPYGSRTINSRKRKEVDLMEEYDDVIEPAEGHSRNYVVPRVNACTSKIFVKYLNDFGNAGGFALILDALENGEVSADFNLPTIAYLTTLISMPHKLWAKGYVAEFGPRVIKASKKLFLDSADKSLRGIDPGIIAQVTEAIGLINSRLTDPAASRQSTEIFKLELIRKQLTSELLENRIQGIRELNDNIQDNADYDEKNWSVADLIEWITQNGLFSAIWEPR